MDALMLEIKRYIEANQLIRPGDGVVVGLSGGPDSVFLLYALHTLQARMGFTLRAVHVHHGIRGAEADRDEAFSEKLCAKLDIPFQAVHVGLRRTRRSMGSAWRRPRASSVTRPSRPHGSS